jgi:hypothetical protein
LNIFAESEIVAQAAFNGMDRTGAC